MRVNKTLGISLFVAITISILIVLLFILFNNQIVSFFLVENTHAYKIAIHGIPYFASGFIFFALNMIMIGYYQSIEYTKSAIVFTIIRGFILMLACFILLPVYFHIKGIWIAVPSAELITFLIISLFYATTRKNPRNAL